MLLAAIIGEDSKCKTANLANSILSSTGKKVNIIDSKNISGMSSKQIKSYLNELEKNNTDILILKINPVEVKEEVFNDMQFDVIICNHRSDGLTESKKDEYISVMRKIFSLLGDRGIAIVNVDDFELVQFLHGMKHYLVTYGFNSKASITTSSTGDIISKDNFMCCLQRTITTKNGTLIEPQEYKIKVGADDFDAYNVLAAATFAIVNDVDLNAINMLDIKN